MNEFEKRDPGTFTGHDPELAPEKVPGGVAPREPGPDAWSSEPEAHADQDAPVDANVQGTDDDR